MLKKLLLTLVLLFSSLYAYDTRLDNYPNGRALYEKASANNVNSAFDLGLLYKQKIKDYKEAAFWYKKAYKLGSVDAAFNMGIMYEDLKKYNKAIEWYEKASIQQDKKAPYNLALIYEEKLKNYSKAIKWYQESYNKGYLGGANSLGLLYEQKLKDNKNAEFWYKEAAKKGFVKSYKNLALFNRDKGNTIEGASWYIALIDIKYPKQKVINYLKTKWKLTDEELKNAYKLQQTLDIPKHYLGGID